MIGTASETGQLLLVKQGERGHAPFLVYGSYPQVLFHFCGFERGLRQDLFYPGKGQAICHTYFFFFSN